MVSILAVAISVVGLITTVVIGARKAIIRGSQATGKFAKTFYNLGKKLGGLIAPLLSAKGLSWLSSNPWVLVLALTWFTYNQYKQRRK